MICIHVPVSEKIQSISFPIVLHDKKNEKIFIYIIYAANLDIICPLPLVDTTNVFYTRIFKVIYMTFFFLKSDIWNGPWYKNKKIKCIAKYLISAFPIDKNPSLIRYQLSNKSIRIWNLHDINNDLNAHEFTIWSTEKNDDIHTHTQKWILSGKKS